MIPARFGNPIEKRLEEGPVRFELEVQIASSGDDPNDPSAVWPQERERILRFSAPAPMKYPTSAAPQAWDSVL